MTWKHCPFVFVALLCVVLTGCDRGKSDDHGHDHPHNGGHDHAGDQGHEHPHDEGHDHGEKAAEPELEPIAVTQFTSKLMLFMEYRPPIAGREARFSPHLTVIEDGAPVRSGRISVQYTGPSGQSGEFVSDKPLRGGLYVPTGTFPQPGEYEVKIAVRSDQVQDTIDLGRLTVYPNAKTAAAAIQAAGEPEPEPEGVVPFLLEQQWPIGTVLRQVTRRTLVQRLPVAGEIQPARGGAAALTAPVAGRLLRAGADPLPGIGDRVEAGQVLARVELPLPDVELVLRQLDIASRLAEVEQDLEQAQATLEYAQAALKRAETLRERGLNTDEQLETSRHELRLAEVRSRSAEILKDRYEESRKKLQALRGPTADGDLSGAAAEPLSLPLIAPITGQVVAARHVEGEQVEAGQEVLRIVNSERVWVVAHVSELDTPHIAASPDAVVSLPGMEGSGVSILATPGGRLIHFGTVVEEQARTVPIHYEIPNPDGRFRVGMSVDVQVEMGRASHAVVIPESAVVMDNGRPTAYVLLGGESFQKRDVQLGVRDMGFVEVLRGIAEGDWVVARNAYAIKLAAQSPSSFGHGHVH